MRFGFLEPWHVFLPRAAGHVVALSGSGGKTTLLCEIARAWAAEGLPVVATTTTRTEPVPGFMAVDPAAVGADAPDAPLLFRHGGTRADGKWAGLSPAEVDALEVNLPGRLVVVEVDGAATRPFKDSRAGEPVWPERTSLAVVVLGIGGVGEPAGSVVHRLGRGDVRDPVGVAPDALWSWDHAHELLVGAGGYLAQVPDHVPVVLALAGMEQQPDSVGLFAFVARAMAHPRLPLVLFCSRGPDGCHLRAACRENDDRWAQGGGDGSD